MSELFFSLFFPYVATNLLQTKKQNKKTLGIQYYKYLTSCKMQMSCKTEDVRLVPLKKPSTPFITP